MADKETLSLTFSLGYGANSNEYSTTKAGIVRLTVEFTPNNNDSPKPDRDDLEIAFDAAVLKLRNSLPINFRQPLLVATNRM